MLINFPVDNPQYRDTGEGGMFVTLAVLPPEAGWGCFGTDNIRVFEYESLLAVYNLEEKKFISHEDLFYFDNSIKHSVYFLFAANIAATNQALVKGDFEYWLATPDALTEQGRELLKMVEGLYPDCVILLMTWLDT